MEKGNDFPLHYKAYLNSLEYESQYMYFFLAYMTFKIRHTSNCKNQNTSIFFSKLDDLGGFKLSGLSEQSLFSLLLKH